MMVPKPITLPKSAVALTTRRGKLDPTEDLYVSSLLFTAACGESPSGSWGGDPARYRVQLTIEGWPALDEFYYVGGWQDEGLVSLIKDEAPRRREAIMAQRARRNS